MRARVVVAGAFGIDTNVYVGGSSGGETTFADVRDGLGHAGCYSARGFAALGAEVVAVAALGADPLGAWVRDVLTGEGVEVVELRDPGGTHRSVNLIDAAGGRRNHFDPRRSAEVVVDEQRIASAVQGAALAHVQIEDWCRGLLPILRSLGCRISCDLQDVRDLDDPYRAEFVAAADVLFCSAAGLPDPAGAAAELAGRRADRIVVIGLGADGCLVATGSSVEHHPPVPFSEPVVDTNGAGDSLAVGFLVAHLLERRPLPEAVRRAQLGARVVCGHRADEKRFVTPAELDELGADPS